MKEQQEQIAEHVISIEDLSGDKRQRYPGTITFSLLVQRLKIMGKGSFFLSDFHMSI